MASHAFCWLASSVSPLGACMQRRALRHSSSADVHSEVDVSPLPLCAHPNLTSPLPPAGVSGTAGSSTGSSSDASSATS